MHKPTKIFRITTFILLIISTLSCENNIDVIKNLTNKKELPAASVSDIEMSQSESGRLRFKMMAKQLDRYITVEKNYTEFPKGITIYVYDSLRQVESVFTAGYAIYHENKRLWEAHNNVVAKNVKKGDQLNSEELFWDETKSLIYSNKFTRIVNADGVFTGEGGFESNEDLTKWKLKGIKGAVNIKESTEDPDDEADDDKTDDDDETNP